MGYGGRAKSGEACEWLIFEWIDRAYEDRVTQLLPLAVAPYADPLRHDPRFAVVLKKIGLEGVSPAV